jgi:hypothetical protein
MGNCKAQIPLLLLPLLFVMGCNRGHRMGEVEGIVQRDGKPLPRIRVTFMPDPEQGTTGPISVGTTDEEGRFKLTCADSRAGAVVGWHRVVMTDPTASTYRRGGAGRARFDDETESPPAQNPPARPQYRIPFQYTTSARTPLKVEVKPEKQEMSFDLKP